MGSCFHGVVRRLQTVTRALVGPWAPEVVRGENVPTNESDAGQWRAGMATVGGRPAKQLSGNQAWPIKLVLSVSEQRDNSSHEYAECKQIDRGRTQAYVS